MKNKKHATYHYTPDASPTVTDLGGIGKLSDYLDEEEQKRWTNASRQPDICEQMTNDIGSFQAVEIDGNLHVKGNFNVAQHRIAALWIKGDLIVDGVYEDQSHPQCFVLIEGSLRATNIITGAQLEVHGDVIADNLAGDYNDYGANFFGRTKATTFFPETHSFEFLGGSDIALTLGEGVPSPESMDFYACAFIKETFVDSYNEVNKSKLIEALAQGNSIAHTNPRDPSNVTHLSLVERGLEVLPESLYAFVNLTDLNIEDNKFTKLDGLEQLVKLETLSIVGNPITSLSENLMSLSLKSLNVGYGIEIPDWFARWESLETLEIWVDELVVLPKIVAKIPSLTRLVLADWGLGQSELFLADLLPTLNEMKLEQLCITSGPITHLPNDLSPLATLKVLELTNQKFDETERSRIIAELPNVDVHF